MRFQICLNIKRGCFRSLKRTKAKLANGKLEGDRMILSQVLK